MSELPHRLSQGSHKITYRPKRDDARAELRAAIEREYVHVLFTETRGGTELGFRLDPARSVLSEANWEAGEGSVHLEGELNLDGVPVRCVADLDLRSMEGEGHLEILEPSPVA
ncbi:MAG TPA: hypothetical protein VFJ82_25835 [Longimicrobium sp.]|nr:hypothetical protein [Longimicrobium sp.]